MKNIMTFSLVILLFGLLSCAKRDRITTVSGTVVDYGNGEPVEDITVRITDGINLSDPIFGDYGDFSGKVAETTTNENGEFTISIEGKNPAAVAPVDPDFSDYWNYDQGETAVSNSFDGYENGSNTQGEIYIMKAKAYLGLQLLNKDEVQDSIRFTEIDKMGNESLNPQIRFSKGITQYTGTYAIIGNDYYRFRLDYMRDGEWNSLIDSIYVAKGDTITDVIYY